MKLTASPFYILSDLAGPGVGGGSGRAHARRPPLSLRDISPAPRGNRPQTPAGPIFSYGRKGSKRPFKRAPAPDGGRPPLSLRDISPTQWGNLPLKIPRWGALWPRPQTPRPETLVVTTDVLRANRCAPFAGKFLRFIGLPQNQATVRQPISPVLSAGCSESSQCNLSLYRANWAGC